MSREANGFCQSAYVRDAQGNTLATYELENGALQWREQTLYGSSRLGVLRPEVDLTGLTAPVWEESQTIRTGKSYELSNHLGNVLAVVTDRKVAVDDNTDGMADYFTAALLSAQEYYPFGMEMPGRTFTAPSTEGYRYGFNGKEKDTEGEWGGLTHYDYGFRIYNPGIGRFLSVDPLSPEYPWYTPYQFAGNSPILNIDLDGLEPYDVNDGSGGTVKSSVTTDNIPVVSAAQSGLTSKAQRALDKRSFHTWPGVKMSSTPNRHLKNSTMLSSIFDPYLDYADKLNIREGSAGHLNELLDLSFKGYDVVNFTKDLRWRTMFDVQLLKSEFKLLEEIKADERYGKEDFHRLDIRTIEFGGYRGSFNPKMVSFYTRTLPAAANPLTWALRHAAVRTFTEVSKSGKITINYKVHDYLELHTRSNRSFLYNTISSGLGVIYHETLGGNRNLQTRVKWQKNYY